MDHRTILYETVEPGIAQITINRPAHLNAYTNPMCAEIVEALYAYRDSPAQGTPTPFLIVHRRLAQLLSEFPHLVKYEGNKSSRDIFNNESECSQWSKV